MVKTSLERWNVWAEFLRPKGICKNKPKGVVTAVLEMVCTHQVQFREILYLWKWVSMLLGNRHRGACLLRYLLQGRCPSTKDGTQLPSDVQGQGGVVGQWSCCPDMVRHIMKDWCVWGTDLCKEWILRQQLQIARLGDRSLERTPCLVVTCLCCILTRSPK